MAKHNIFVQAMKSVSYAWRGICYVFRHEQNFRVQVAVGIFVSLAAYWFPLSRIELLLVFGLIMGVLILEILNSVIEKFVDIVKPRLTYQVKIVKDMMAASVLIASIGAAIIGCIIFIPHIIELFM
jgi:diacylglycerol kinase